MGRVQAPKFGGSTLGRNHPLNHALIAQHALHYRNSMVVDSYTAGRFNPASVAALAVECGDPTIDTAIRRIGTAWVRGGLDAQRLDKPWHGGDVDQLFVDDPSLLDAIDDIIRTVHRVRFSRPRRALDKQQHGAHRPASYRVQAR